jgi:hypothetical protein
MHYRHLTTEGLQISPEIDKLRRLKVKKILAYSSIFLVVMMAALSVSAGAADFTGSWKRDASKSTLAAGPGGGGGGTGDVWLTVKQEGDKLTATRKTERGENTTTYNLKGEETKNELTGRMTGTATHKTKWQGDGKILEINSVTKGNFQGNEFTATAVAHWELMDGGKTLKIHTERESPQGKMTSTEIFVKQ